MTTYSLENNILKSLEETSFSDEGILERQNLQAALKENIEVVAPNCLVISEEFSEWDELREDDFGRDTRIILVSANFSKKLTTSVIWLNERNLDIRCVRLIPYKNKDEIFIDVQQVIPLPEAESYQVKLRQKSEEIREAKESSRDYTKYKFDGQIYNKRNLVKAVVKKWIQENNPINIDDLKKAFPDSIRAGGLFFDYEEAKQTYERQNIYRHFLSEDELIIFKDNTKYALTNQ